MKRKNIFPYLLILPTLCFLGVFCFYPMLRGFGYSITDYDRSDPMNYSIVGLQNFIDIFTKDKIFWPAVKVSVKWVLVQVSLQLTLGMIFALILNAKFVGRSAVRTFCFAPWAVSGALTTILWFLIYNEHIGLLNQMLTLLGKGGFAKSLDTECKNRVSFGGYLGVMERNPVFHYYTAGRTADSSHRALRIG